MKKLFMIGIFLGLSQTLYGSGTLKIYINDSKLSNNQSPLYLYVFENESSWNNEQATKILKISPNEFKNGYTINNLESKRYAISSYQDVNYNNIIDKNIFGVPTEPFAISNLNDMPISFPQWEEISIQIKNNEVTVLNLHFQ